MQAGRLRKEGRRQGDLIALWIYEHYWYVCLSPLFHSPSYHRRSVLMQSATVLLARAMIRSALRSLTMPSSLTSRSLRPGGSGIYSAAPSWSSTLRRTILRSLR